jgi:excisionase family DNA binding protein
MAGERLLTVAEVADRLRMSEETVRRWLRSGRLEGFRIGGTKLGYRIPESAIEAVVDWAPTTVEHGGGASHPGPCRHTCPNTPVASISARCLCGRDHPEPAVRALDRATSWYPHQKWPVGREALRERMTKSSAGWMIRPLDG